jgi:type I restriction enzyme S subunit
MVERLTAAQRQYNENALLIAAIGLIFKRLSNDYAPKFLGDIADTTSGGTPLRNISTYYDGDIPWIKSGELNDGVISEVEEFITQEGLENSSAKIFPKGTLVVALYGATVGKTGILGLDTSSNQAVCAVFPKTDIVSSEFLFWFLRYKRPDFLGNSFGGAQPNISQKLLRATEIPVPPQNLQEVICNFLKVVERRQNGDKIVDYPSLPSEFADIRRIVERIESLAARIAEAQSLRREISEDLDTFISSYHVHCSDRVVKLKDILFLDEDRERIQAGNAYPQVGVKGFGKGLFAREILMGTQTTYKWFHRLYPGAIVLSQVKGWEGAIGVCDDMLVGKFVSPEYRTFRCIPGQAHPEYLRALVSTPYFYLKLKDLSRGVGGRRERIRPELFIELEIPMPDIRRQEKAVEIFSKFSALKALQESTRRELESMLPSVLDRAFKGEL